MLFKYRYLNIIDIHCVYNLIGEFTESESETDDDPSPLRVRFVRPENEFQKKRREESVTLRNKVAEHSSWISLDLEKSTMVIFKIYILKKFFHSIYL